MIVVIQCAASKRPAAGRLVTKEGRLIDFVAHPEIAPVNSSRLYARPDDISDDGTSWRARLWNYNRAHKGNPLKLCAAYRLYENKCYGHLVSRFGLQNVYILSAGWGLIRSDFLTPYYDITFSQNADPYKRRHKVEKYDDFRLLADETTDDVVFVGGKDYLPLFCQLTNGIRGTRIAFFNSANAPTFGNCMFRRFETTTRTNWHYECAQAIIEGKLSL